MVELSHIQSIEAIAFPTNPPQPASFNKNLIFINLAYSDSGWTPQNGTVAGDPGYVFPNMFLHLNKVHIAKYQHIKGDGYDRCTVNVFINTYYEKALEVMFTALQRKLLQWYPGQQFKIKIPLFNDELTLTMPTKLDSFLMTADYDKMPINDPAQFFETDCPNWLTPGTTIDVCIWALAWVNPLKQEAGWSFKLRSINVIDQSRKTLLNEHYCQLPLPQPPPPTPVVLRPRPEMPEAPRKKQPFRSLETPSKYGVTIKTLKMTDEMPDSIVDPVF